MATRSGMEALRPRKAQTKVTRTRKDAKGRPPLSNYSSAQRETQVGDEGEGNEPEVYPKAKASQARDQVNVWACEECQVDFTNDDDKLVSCSRCHKYFCIECIEMNDSQYETLSRPDVFWLCPDCMPKTNHWNSDSLLEEKCEVIMGELQKRMESLELRLEEKLDTHVRSITQKLPDQLSTLEMKLENQLKSLSEEMPQSMTKTWTSLFKKDEMTESQPSFKTIMKETLEEQKKEDVDRENRENNIIIYNVEESEQVDTGERKKEDVKFFNILCQEVLQISSPSAKNFIRLGRKPAAEDSQRPRPLKVVMDSKDDRSKIMRNLTKLKDAEERYRKISITYDYCQEDREKIKTKVVEAKQLEEGDQSKNFRYRVRGPPWDLRIIKIAKQPTEGAH